MEIIGKSVIRKEAFEKVTGKARYTTDYSAQGQLYGQLVLSKYAHAEIISITTDRAMEIPGVRGVLTGEGLPLTGEEMKDRPPVAWGKVRYHGEVTAVVIADDPVTAAKAANLVEIDYSPLPVVQTPSEAVKENAPLVHENTGRYEKDEGINPIPGTNIASHTKIRKGSIQKGREESEVTIEESFFIPPSDHAAMETRSATAEVKPDGKVIITTSSQAPFMVKKLMNSYFGIELGKVVVHTPLVGGGYGGKASVQQEILAYLASMKAGGRPVKIVYPREADLITAPCHMGMEATIKLWATRDGKLKAAEIQYLVEAGAYSDKAIHLTRAAAIDCTGPYFIENIWCDSYCVYTNHPYPAPYRGFSHSEVHFCFERAMDILAEKLSMDPLELRYKNAIRPGHTTPTQYKVNRSTVGDLPECIRRLKKLIRWEEGAVVRINERRLKVKGISCLWKNSTIPPDSTSGAIITFNEDGTANLISGVVEIGTGTKTVLAQIVAETLKMDINDIFVRMEIDTQTTPEHWKTVASRGTLMGGRAAMAAAEDAARQLKAIASCVLRTRTEDLDIADSRVFIREEPDKGLHFKDIAYGYTFPNGNSIGGQIIGRGNYILRNLTHIDKETGKGKPGPEWAVGAQGVEIEFDCRDYTYRIITAISVLDAGRVLNWKAARGQVTGAMSMGLAFAGREAFIFDKEGRILNPQLRTYRPLHFSERPEYIVDFVETPHVDAPFGARGLGEQGLISLPAALGNALSAAVGLQITSLPLTPETIWRMKEAER
ncbi:xanthine dehydrogenase family protein molybdopterin-binding subunit [Evansella sp. LMS18]|uniref:xanthine dehydrogenase family protein molybdopterin-binding subunit n=1 Tax=Evansella sp. LMS18 TaxID=2924033 RepID=UPI0020D05D6F|nr:xanthine dehydrogenase family protein molybdopterin-binding subunit [Evansella sp. LMS18]UTR09794.1 xanthine dehydrogenase family protein molybdopterin-binding subunit [Evansella sp. LMS18]